MSNFLNNKTFMKAENFPLPIFFSFKSPEYRSMPYVKTNTIQ